MAISLDADVITRGEKGTFDLKAWLESQPDDSFEVAAITQRRAVGFLADGADELTELVVAIGGEVTVLEAGRVRADEEAGLGGERWQQPTQDQQEPRQPPPSDPPSHHSQKPGPA